MDKTRQAIEQLLDALIHDITKLPVDIGHELQPIFALARGTSEYFPGRQLDPAEQINYITARNRTISLFQIDDQKDFYHQLRPYFEECVSSFGGQAFLLEFLHIVEIHKPGVLSKLNEVLSSLRPDIEYRFPGQSTEELQAARLLVANESVDNLARQAVHDLSRPVYHPVALAGWLNDPNGLTYDQEGNLHIFFQHNPFNDSWNHLHWGHGYYAQNGSFYNMPVAMEPQPENGYTLCFSGSVPEFKLQHPESPKELAYGAFFTAVGPGENTFLHAPPTVLAFCLDPKMQVWEARRYQLTDSQTYHNKVDQINQCTVEDRWDVRDPFVFKRDDKLFMLQTATAVPGRQGHAVIVLLTPGNSEDLTAEWKYQGDTFQYPVSDIKQGAPGIIECPNLHRIGGRDILFFSSLRRPEEGALTSFDHHAATEFFLGHFDSETGKFTADSDSNAHGVLDYGRAFYAPNSCVKTEDQEITFVGWVKNFEQRQNWFQLKDSHSLYTAWNGCLTTPRLLTYENNQVCVNPDPLIAKLRAELILEQQQLQLGEPAEEESFLIYQKSSDNLNHRHKHRQLDIEAVISLQDKNSQGGFIFYADQHCQRGTRITFNGSAVLVESDIQQEVIPLESPLDSVSIRILLDRSLIEVFCQNKALTQIASPELSRVIANEIRRNYPMRDYLWGRGVMFEDIRIYQMKKNNL